MLEQARKNPDVLCIGIDASQSGLIEASTKAGKKPSRGGASNAFFILSGVESLPEDLENIADAITINYPWGSLLDSVTRPSMNVLKTIARLARAESTVDVLINFSVFEDETYRKRLGLPDLTLLRAQNELKSAYWDAGLKITKCAMVGENDHVKTTWGQKLVKGSQRRILAISCRKIL